MKYLLDTNILSEPLRPEPDDGVLRRLRDHRGEVATASVVWHEMLFACYRLPPSARRSAIQEYLDEVLRPSLSILHYDARAAEWHAAERARSAGEGRTPPSADGQIAAVARTNGLIVVTLNVAGYSGFRDVGVEDWSVA